MNEAETPGLDTLPRLIGERVTLRPGTPEDVPLLHAVLSEPSVVQWWGKPDNHEVIAAHLRGEDDTFLLVIEVDRAAAGGIQYYEEEDPMYRHAGIDIFLSSGYQGRGLGREAMALLVGFLREVRHHHRLIIDPAAENLRAIRCYESVGFRPVGVMRQYERGVDGLFHDGLLMDLVATDLASQAELR